MVAKSIASGEGNYYYYRFCEHAFSAWLNFHGSGTKKEIPCTLTFASLIYSLCTHYTPCSSPRSVTLQYIYTHIQLFNPSTPRGMEFSLNHHQDTSIYRFDYPLFLAEGSTSEGISSQQSLQPPLSVRSKGKSCSKALITSWPWIDEKNFDWTAPSPFY